ncbi:MAG: hypothetical protein ACRDT6_11260 [Micromonosporaceae bacterium]
MGHYPVPKLHRRSRLGRWTVLTYQRVGTGRPDEGLLLDEITRAELTDDTSRLDACLDDVLAHYRSTITATLRRSPLSATVQKLYGERARAGGRLDRYYGSDEPLLAVKGSDPVRPSDLHRNLLMVNGRPYRVDYAALVAWLRKRFDPTRLEPAAITQGDPTDFNIGWTPAGGPVWFDYDTGGLNAVAGEFANFLWYQFLLGCWLVPTHNPHAFADHPAGITTQQFNRPTVSLERGHDRLVIDYQHRPSPARRRAIAKYHTELVQPIATRLSVTDLMDWLRPWLAMRILAVHRLCDMRPTDAALSVAFLAQVLDAETTIDSLSGIAPEMPHRTLERKP